MKGIFNNGKMIHHRRKISLKKLPLVQIIREEYDIIPDLGLQEGHKYDFELFSNKAIVKLKTSKFSKHI